MVSFTNNDYFWQKLLKHKILQIMADINENPIQNSQTEPEIQKPEQEQAPQESSRKSMFNEPLFNDGEFVKSEPDNNMTLAIIATVASVITGCCGGVGCIGLVTSIIAIVFSSQVKSKFSLGDIDGAESSAKNSKTLSYVSLGLSAISVVVWIILLATGAFAAYLEQIQKM